MMRYLARRVGRVPRTTPNSLRAAAFRTAGPALSLLLTMVLILAGCQNSPHEPEPSETGTATGAGATAGASQVAQAQAPSRSTRSTRPMPTPKPTPPLPDFAAGSVLVQVMMKEYAYLPNPLTLKSGERTTLALINRGKKAHEFQIGRDVAPDKSGFKEDLFAGLEVKIGTSPEDARKPTPEVKDDSLASNLESASDSASNSSTESNPDSDSSSSSSALASDSSAPTRAVIPAGATIYMTFTLPRDRRGEWEMGCFENLHYGSGMSGKVRVE